MRNHLRRLERCMLAGAVVAMLAAVLAVSKRKALTAQAAASHETLTHLMVTGIICVTLVVGLGVFVLASVAARGRQRRARCDGRDGRSGGGQPGDVARARRRRARYGGEW